MIIPGKIIICIQVTVDEAGDNPDIILITEAPEFITVYTGEKLNTDHFIYGLVRTLYFSVD